MIKYYGALEPFHIWYNLTYSRHEVRFQRHLSVLFQKLHYENHSNLFIMHYDHQCYVFIPLYRGDHPYHYLVHHILDKGIFVYPRYIVVTDIKFIVPSL